jgi:O-glycosyl hydrolase
MNLDFSEWDYGASQDISGAIATADALGIFGRSGVHAADWFPLGDDNAYAYGAFGMFRNYDGQGGHFANTEVQAATTDPVNTSIYASVDSGDPNHMVIVAINKATNPVTAEVEVKGLDVISADSYVLTSASPLPQKGVSSFGDGNSTFSYTMPAQSISVLLPQLPQD